MNRRTLTLKNAETLINGDRQASYGKPQECFFAVAQMWSAYLGYDIHPKDVTLMMAMLKIIRTKKSPTKPDNYDDMVGYCALSAELAIGDEENDAENKI